MLILLQQYRILNTLGYEVSLRATHTIFHYTTCSLLTMWPISCISSVLQTNTDQAFRAVVIYQDIKCITTDVYHDIALFKIRAYTVQRKTLLLSEDEEALQCIVILEAIKLFRTINNRIPRGLH